MQPLHLAPAPLRGPAAEMRLLARNLIESAALLIALTVTERLLFGPGFYAGLVQHPFWIVVLLAAVQGGLYPGVGAAALAILMLDQPPRPVGMDITQHYIQSALLPMQWLATSLCIGLYRQLQIERERHLREENARLRETADLLAEELTRTDAALGAAELRLIVADPEPVPGAGLGARTGARTGAGSGTGKDGP